MELLELQLTFENEGKTVRFFFLEKRHFYREILLKIVSLTEKPWDLKGPPQIIQDIQLSHLKENMPVVCIISCEGKAAQTNMQFAQSTYFQLLNFVLT